MTTETVTALTDLIKWIDLEIAKAPSRFECENKVRHNTLLDTRKEVKDRIEKGLREP